MASWRMKVPTFLSFLLVCLAAFISVYKWVSTLKFSGFLVRDPLTVEPSLPSPGDVILTAFVVNTFIPSHLKLKPGHSGHALKF